MSRVSRNIAPQHYKVFLQKIEFPCPELGVPNSVFQIMALFILEERKRGDSKRGDSEFGIFCHFSGKQLFLVCFYVCYGCQAVNKSKMGDLAISAFTISTSTFFQLIPGEK